jgi:hypothetical protein
MTGQHKRAQTSIPSVGFEPMISVLERSKTVHALERAATMIGDGRTSPRFIPEGNSTAFKYCLD